MIQATTHHDSVGWKPWLGGLWRRLCWVIIPLFIFGSLEWSLREKTAEYGLWYYRSKQAAAQQPVDFIFIGSSCTAAAVDPHHFAQQMQPYYDRTVHVDILARGYTTLMHHYFALRNIVETHPQQMRGCVVMIELFEAMPCVAVSGKHLRSDWGGNWTRTIHERPLLASVMQTKDLQRLWRSKTPIDAKIMLSYRHLLEPIQVISQRERVQMIFMEKLYSTRDRLSSILAADTRVQHTAVADLSDAGGIRIDAEGVQHVAAITQQKAATMRAGERPLRNFDDTPLVQIHQLCKAYAMKLVLYRMHQSPTMRRSYETPQRLADRAAFARWAANRGIPIIDFDLHYGAADFPDGLHMSRTLGRQFTAKLVQSLMDRHASGHAIASGNPAAGQSDLPPTHR